LACSPELCGDEAALSKAFAADVQHRFRTERRGLLGFKRRGFEFVDAKGSRVTKHMLELLHDVGQLAGWPQMARASGHLGMKNPPESMTEGGTSAGSSDCIPVGAASVPHARSPVSFDMPAAHGLPARILVHTRSVPP